MSFFDKIYDIAHTDLFKYVFHSGRDKVFVANVSKIIKTTLNFSPFLAKRDYTLRLANGMANPSVSLSSATCVHYPTQGV